MTTGGSGSRSPRPGASAGSFRASPRDRASSLNSTACGLRSETPLVLRTTNALARPICEGIMATRSPGFAPRDASMPSQILATKLAPPAGELPKASEPWSPGSSRCSSSRARQRWCIRSCLGSARYGDLWRRHPGRSRSSSPRSRGWSRPWELSVGALSRRYPRAAVTLFALSELGIGLYGAFSLRLFALIAEVTHGTALAMSRRVGWPSCSWRSRPC